MPSRTKNTASRSHASARSSKAKAGGGKPAGDAAPLVPLRRKAEILGLVLMALAALVGLALVTYHPPDDAFAARLSLADALLDPGAHPEQGRAHNALGLVGAELAAALVPGFLGYTTLIAAALLFAWGYAVFRHRPLAKLPFASALAVAWMVLLASGIGWFAHAFVQDYTAWAGAVGMGIASWLRRVFGGAGSFLLVALGASVLTLLTLDPDVQRALDRLWTWMRGLRDTVAARGQAWSDERARARAEREARRPASASAEATPAAPAKAAPAPPSEPMGDAAPPAPAAEARPAEASAAAAPPPSEPAAPETAADAVPPLGAADVPRRNDLFRHQMRLVRVERPTPSDASDAPASEPPASEPPASEPPAESGRPAPEPSPPPASELPEVMPSRPAAASPAPVAEPAAPPPEPGPVAREPEPAEAETPDDEAAAFDAAVEAARAHETAGRDAVDLEDVFHLDDASDEDADEQDAAPPVTPPTAEAAVAPAPVVPAPEPDAEEPDAEEPDAADGAPQEPALHVQEQVEEEKADDIQRPADAPAFDAYVAPTLALLDESGDDDPTVDYEELEANKQILLDKLAIYNIEIEDIVAVVGPTVTRYELTPAPGVKVSRIKALEDDLAMAMAAQGIRMIAPIPGKSAVGVEIPNRKRELVRLRDVLGTARFRDTDMELPVPVGKSIEGEVFLADLTKMPHFLIAGATGSGKSVGLNALITGLLYACHPANLKFVIVDPKKIELQEYGMLLNHFIAKPKDTDDAIVTDIDEALGVLKSVEKEMEARYDLLSTASVRGIRSYNRKIREGRLLEDDGHRHLPYIVVVVDELADLMMTAGKEIEGPIARLAQMARAVGIHLVLATQRPSVDVITGLIKANFPSRMAYEVASRVDSRTILDQMGAEQLIGNGDLLFQSGSKLLRLQGPFVSIDEVDRVCSYIGDQEGEGPYALPSLSEAGHGPDVTLGVEGTDDLFREAARIIVRHQQGSVSLLQRKLSVGYTRAARIVDQLEEAGIVGLFAGTKAREVLVEDLEELEQLFEGE